MTTTNEWDEAARKAAEENDEFEKAKRAAVDMIVFSYPNSPHPEENGWHVYNAITKTHAELKATYEKLCELVVWCKREVDYADPSTDYDSLQPAQSQPRTPRLVDAVDNILGYTAHHPRQLADELCVLFDKLNEALAAEKKRQELVDEMVAASGDFVRWFNASKVHSPADVEFMVKRMVLAKSNLDAFNKEAQ